MRTSKERNERRKKRIRKKISIVTTRKRLSVFKSGRHIYAQIIDDITEKTIVSASTLDKDIRTTINSNYSNKNFATRVGEILANKAIKEGIKEVVFDKGGYKYHGVIKALADSARKSLQF